MNHVELSIIIFGAVGLMIGLAATLGMVGFRPKTKDIPFVGGFSVCLLGLGMLFGTTVGMALYGDEVRGDRKEEEILAIAKNPGAWLRGEIDGSPILTMDGALTVIRRKREKLEHAATSTQDGKKLMLYGSAVGALNRLADNLETDIRPRRGR